LLLCVAGCAQNLAYDEGLGFMESGNFEAGLAKLDEAARRNPRNFEYRQAYFRQREVALQRLFAQAEVLRQQRQWDAAEKAYLRVLALDPANPQAVTSLEATRIDRRQRARLDEADALLKKGDQAGAEARARSVLAETPANRQAQALLRKVEESSLRTASAMPQLGASLREAITLDFRDATLRQVFEALSRGASLNFVFDRDVKQDSRVTIFVRNSSIEDVLRFVLVTNQLERKVLSENTVLIYPNTAAKIRDYQDLVVRTFYLSNADAKTTANLIRALVKTKDLFVDEKLNVLVIRDTPDAVRMAERLVTNLDLAEPEVMLEVEVLEVGLNKLLALGVGWPNSLSVGLVGAGGTPGSITLTEWRNRSSDLVHLTFTDPLVALNFRNSLDSTNLLANPRIRVKNKDKAKVHIGDKVPVITTTTTATGFASESVTYLDVGLKLEVEPTVSLDDEVAIRIALEVSNIAREIRSSTTSTLTYQVGTRNATTSLRLKDGETQILAGLISNEDRKSVNQVPGLGDLPLLGRLFGAHQDTHNKTEIVLLITPRVVRNLARPEAGLEEFASGTDAAVGSAPLRLQSATAAPAASTSRKPAPPLTKLTLEAPSTIGAGEEFQVAISLDSPDAVRSGLIDFAFDASRLAFVKVAAATMLSIVDKNAALRASAPQGIGRLNISFGSKNDVKGQGALFMVTFKSIGTGAMPSTIRVEAASFTNAGGQVVSASLPPPVALPSR